MKNQPKRGNRFWKLAPLTTKGCHPKKREPRHLTTRGCLKQKLLNGKTREPTELKTNHASVMSFLIPLGPQGFEGGAAHTGAARGGAPGAADPTKDPVQKNTGRATTSVVNAKRF